MTIKSCSECTKNCCQWGPGPYKVIPMEAYIEGCDSVEGYNTQCEHFTDGKCAIWGTDEHPLICRTWICNVRSYSDDELAAIRKLPDEEKK